MKKVLIDPLTKELIITEFSEFEMNQIEYRAIVKTCSRKINDYIGYKCSMRFRKTHPTPTRNLFYANPEWRLRLKRDCEELLNMHLPSVVCHCGIPFRWYISGTATCKVCGNVIGMN